jgi:hypothetical protein
MSALTAARVQLVFKGTIKKTTYPLKTGATAWAGGIAAIDTANPGYVFPFAAGTTTTKPIGWFLDSVNNSAGGTTVPIGVELFREHDVTYYDSVTGAGAVTAANLFQTLYGASDHEVTTSSSGSAPVAGVMLGFGPQGYPNAIGVEAPW